MEKLAPVESAEANTLSLSFIPSKKTFIMVAFIMSITKKLITREKKEIIEQVLSERPHCSQISCVDVGIKDLGSNDNLPVQEAVAPRRPLCS